MTLPRRAFCPSEPTLKYEHSSTSVLLPRVVALNHPVSMTLLNECFSPNFDLVSIWMKFPFHWVAESSTGDFCNEGVLTRSIYAIKANPYISPTWRVESLALYTDCPWSPTEIFQINTVDDLFSTSVLIQRFMIMNFPFYCPDTSAALPHRLTFSQWLQCPQWLSEYDPTQRVSLYLCEWISHLIVLIHQLPSTSALNHRVWPYSTSVPNHRVSMTLLNECP